MKEYILMFLSLISMTCFSQSIIEVETKNELKQELNKLITTDYKQNDSESLKVVLEFKIDSLGEIHSCHVRWSKNLDFSQYYLFAKELETKYRIKFLFNDCKKTPNLDKYAYCLVPFEIQ